MTTEELEKIEKYARILVSFCYDENNVSEVSIDEISPSKQYIRLSNNWWRLEDVKFIEKLPHIYSGHGGLGAGR